jgi:hypothetical protein
LSDIEGGSANEKYLADSEMQVGQRGTGAICNSEKGAEFPFHTVASERLWSTLTGICPQDNGTIRESAGEISARRDWLAEGGIRTPETFVDLEGQIVRSVGSLSGLEISLCSIGITFRRRFAPGSGQTFDISGPR